jgi:hypothetical protein
VCGRVVTTELDNCISATTEASVLGRGADK